VPAPTTATRSPVGAPAARHASTKIAAASGDVTTTQSNAASASAPGSASRSGPRACSMSGSSSVAMPWRSSARESLSFLPASRVTTTVGGAPVAVAADDDARGAVARAAACHV
jgi:hypothetical protein